MSRAALVAMLVACSSSSDAPPPPPPVVPADAPIDGITTINGFDPASGMHLDDDSPSGRTRGKRGAAQGPAIGILLKSEPPGATVFVDGQNYGITPKYWNGVADGTEHEFAFTLAKYGLARYRFVPITSGTLHATLVRVAGGETLDAGLEPVIAPKLAPDAAFTPDAAIAPPPTVLAPVDAGAPASQTIDAAQAPAKPKDDLLPPGSLGPNP